MAEKYLNINLYRVFLLVTKIIPMLLAGIHAINSIGSYFEIEIKLLNYIGGISIPFIIYLYIASYTFKLCSYYRMFLHYTVIISIINIIDYYICIPINDFEIMMIYSVITILVMFIILYLKFFK